MNSKNCIKKIIFFMLPLIAVLFFQGCSSKTTSNNELVLGTTIGTKSIDPAKDYCGWYTVRYGVSETLFKLDEAMNIIPNLALGYENIDKYTWKINLRNDVKFQNGENMTPEKVKLSIERAIDKNSRAKETLNIKKIYIEDSNLFIVTNEANPTIINDLCDPFASIIDVEGTQDFDNEPIGTGPFKVEKFDGIKSSYYSKYENYWQGEPELDKIKVIRVSDSDTLAMALQTGEIDVAEGISYSSLKLFEKSKEYKIEGIDTSRVVVLYYNYRNQYLSDFKLRKAINLAIDKEKYCRLLLDGAATPASGAFPQSMEYSIDEDFIDKINLEKANEILDKNGYIDMNKDGIREKDGKGIQINLITYSSRAELPILAQAIQSDLKKIGIDVQIEVSDSIMDKLKSGNFEMALYSNVTASTGDGAAYLSNLLKTNGDSNYGFYSNNETDKLLNDLNEQFNFKKRADLAIQIQKNVINDQAFNFVAYMKLNFVMKSNVINFEVNPTDYYEINYKTKLE